MEHSTAILEDAGNALRQANSSSPGPGSKRDGNDHNGERKNNYSRRKRKADFPDARMKHGSKRPKGGDKGRGQYFRDVPDKRQRTNESREKREQGKGPKYGQQFSKEEIEAEERKPKRKVAVLIGYSGTGYKGMQISASEKTIEGDLFNAFIAAGAISKANANDPKKASLVRCARTDKGVHAAGNMISLKLIVEDEDIVAQINQALSPQIRVWGIERTIGSFSCYQACDSRWYEYLIPSHTFLPPHPSSWLAKQLEAHAIEAGDQDNYRSRQEEVRGFWEKVEEDEIKAVLASIDEDIRLDVIRALQGEDEALTKVATIDVEATPASVKVGKTLGIAAEQTEDDPEKTEEAAIIINQSTTSVKVTGDDEVLDPAKSEDEDAVPDESAQHSKPTSDSTHNKQTHGTADSSLVADPSPEETKDLRLRAATKRLRHAYTTARRHYRISSTRISRIQAALDKFVGTANYHNYTVQKTFKDPSAKRHIKSFIVNPTPILIGEGAEGDKTEWLSLKVHGQSFMMHQIRKMIGMVTLLVRCGSNLVTLNDSLTGARYSIPKVPGLGLLLERPVFDSYNNVQAPKHGREPLEFSKYETEMEEFKQREIYQRIFREEEEKSEFSKFFSHVDNFKEPWFLYVTSKGLEATKGAVRKGNQNVLADVEGSDDEEVEGGEG